MLNRIFRPGRYVFALGEHLYEHFTPGDEHFTPGEISEAAMVAARAIPDYDTDDAQDDVLAMADGKHGKRSTSVPDATGGSGSIGESTHDLVYFVDPRNLNEVRTCESGTALAYQFEKNGWKQLVRFHHHRTDNLQSVPKLTSGLSATTFPDQFAPQLTHFVSNRMAFLREMEREVAMGGRSYKPWLAFLDAVGGKVEFSEAVKSYNQSNLENKLKVRDP